MRVIGDIARLNAKRYPDRKALIKGNEFLTYGQLNKKANQLANGLIALGVQHGDRVAILAHNCLEFVIVSFGVAKCGAILVPVNFRNKRDELVHVVQNCNPSLLFFGPEFIPIIEEVMDDLYPSVKLITLSGQPMASGPTFESLLDGRSPTEPNVIIDPASALMITYTSGTTGAPKGVLSSHNATLNVYTGMVLEGELREKETTLVSLPLFHTGGMHALLQPTLLRGGTAVIMGRGFDPEKILDAVGRYRVTLTMWVPTMLAILINHPGVEKHYLRTLGKIWYGSSAISPSILEAAKDLFKSRFYQWYGQAETGMISVLRPRDHMDHSQWTGREMFNADLRIVDEKGKDTPEGEIGEIVSAQEHLGMIGYYKMDAANKKTIRNGWIHTGDLARVEENGYFTIVDRMGDVIISGAENIYPQEIENVLLRHPGIREATVFGIPDAVYGESVCAVVVNKEGIQMGPQDIIDFCASQISSYKKPKRIEFVDELPKNASGKVTKNVLREPYWVGHEKRV